MQLRATRSAGSAKSTGSMLSSIRRISTPGGVREARTGRDIGGASVLPPFQNVGHHEGEMIRSLTG
jgi:hypothetical protein